LIGERIAQLGETFQLVWVVRAVEGPAVRHVERPDPQRTARRTDRTRLDLRWRADEGWVVLVRWRVVRRLAVEPARDVVEPDAREDRDAVPSSVAVRGDLVTELFGAVTRERIVGAFRLLQAQHIRLGELQPLVEPRQPRTDRVDVPGRDSHACHPR